MVGRARNVLVGECWVVCHDALPDWEIVVELDEQGRTVGLALSAPQASDADADVKRKLPAGGMMTKVLRQVPFTECEAAVRYFARMLRHMKASELSGVVEVYDGNDELVSVRPVHDGGGLDGHTHADAVAVAEAMPRKGRKQGRSPHATDLELAVLAAEYVGLLAIERYPMKALRARHGDEVVERIRRARRNDVGLLTSAPMASTSDTPRRGGRAGGELTPKAERLLAAAQRRAV